MREEIDGIYHVKDLGRKALMATGLVPEGAVFLTNISKIDSDIFPELIRENIIKRYEEKGYIVTVIEDKAFDTNGRRFDGDAIVGIKKEVRIGQITKELNEISGSADPAAMEKIKVLHEELLSITSNY